MRPASSQSTLRFTPAGDSTARWTRTRAASIARRPRPPGTAGIRGMNAGNSVGRLNAELMKAKDETRVLSQHVAPMFCSPPPLVETMSSPLVPPPPPPPPPPLPLALTRQWLWSPGRPRAAYMQESSPRLARVSASVSCTRRDASVANARTSRGCVMPETASDAMPMYLEIAASASEKWGSGSDPSPPPRPPPCPPPRLPPRPPTRPPPRPPTTAA